MFFASNEHTVEIEDVKKRGQTKRIIEQWAKELSESEVSQEQIEEILSNLKKSL